MAGDGRDVLVVAPCLNEAANLTGLLDQLLADAAAREALIVVADGGSTDASVSIVEAVAAREPRVRLLANPDRIQSAAINLAVARFGGDRRWLVRIDAHAGYPRAYVSRLVATAEAMGAVSVVTPMRTVGRGCFQKAAAAAQNSKLGTGGAAHRGGAGGGWVDHGHHALMAIEAFKSAGGYDEGFSHNEDAELDLRLAQEGGRIWMAADLAIDYYPRSDPGSLFRQYLNYGRGRAKTVARHRTRLKVRQLAPLAVAPAVLAAVLAALLAALTPWALAAALPALVWASLCLAGGALVGWRTRDRCAFGSGLAAMLMHLGWSVGYWRWRITGQTPPRRLPFAEADVVG
jgi:succinoglycan biosynthesis protein ExoA